MFLSVLVVVYVLNLLIAILVDIYSGVRDGALMALTKERVKLLLDYEQRMDRCRHSAVFPRFLLVSYPQGLIENDDSDGQSLESNLKAHMDSQIDLVDSKIDSHIARVDTPNYRNKMSFEKKIKL